jgi:hypothetical protein
MKLVTLIYKKLGKASAIIFGIQIRERFGKNN